MKIEKILAIDRYCYDPRFKEVTDALEKAIESGLSPLDMAAAINLAQFKFEAKLLYKATEERPVIAQPIVAVEHEPVIRPLSKIPENRHSFYLKKRA